MINLLPYNTKRQAHAAQTNVILFRYIIILGFSAGFLVLACMTTYFFIANSKTSTVVPVNGKNSSGSTTQSQTNTSNTNLATTKNILDQQVSYSNIITGIAAALPPGTILESLSLDDGSFGTTTSLKISARSKDSETKIKENFSGSTLFSNYKLQSTTSNQNSSSKYLFTITVGITINKGTTQ